MVVEASRAGPEPFTIERADELTHQYRAADNRLTVLETALGVKAYRRSIRHDLNNILLDVLYEDTGARHDLTPLSSDEWPPPGPVRPADWSRVTTSAAISSLLLNQAMERPGVPGDDTEGVLRWYVPRVLDALDNPDSVYSPDAPAQQQLARLLGDYHNDFLLPWVRNATREALLGRRGLTGHRMALRRVMDNRAVARAEKRWRKEHPGQLATSPPMLYGN